MEASMKNLEVSDARLSSSLASSLQSSSNPDEAMNIVDDSTFQEQFLMEDLDSYFEDINNRLTISRMVSNSVIKGMVSAFSEEAAEKIASKEAEVLLLKERLHSYESNAHKDRSLISSAVVEPRRLNLQELGLEHNCIHEDLDHLKIAAEHQFQRIKKGLEDLKGHSSATSTDFDSVQKQQISKTLVDIEKGLDILKSILGAVCAKPDEIVLASGSALSEWNWEQELQKEIDRIVFHSLLETLSEDFQQMSVEKKSCLCHHNQNKNLLMKVGKLSSLCQDLNDISRSLFGSEPLKLPSQGSLENVEELTNERKDQIQQKALGSHVSASATLQDKIGSFCIEDLVESKTMPPEKMDYLQLKHLTKEDIISYFKTKLTDMKRDHELTLQKMTENFFSLRRGPFKEKGSCHNRKDKDFDTLRKKIEEAILKLNDILLENEKWPMFCNDCENIFPLKERVNNLLSENKHLRDMLTHKSKEVESLSLKLLAASDKVLHHSVAEANFLKCIKKLECDIEDQKMENFVGEDVCKCVLRELIGQNKCHMQDSDIQDSFVREISAIIFRQAVRDVEAAVNLLIAKHSEEKERTIHPEEKLLKNKNALCFAIKEVEKLKAEKQMVNALMEEKEKSALEMGSTLMEQRNHVELVCKELNSLRDQAKQQAVLLVEEKKESHLIKGRLDEALKKIGLYEVEISKLKCKLEVTTNHLSGAEEERSLLFDIIQQKQNSISAAISKEQEQRKKMQFIFASIHELSTAMANFECKATENMTQNYSRLEMLSQQYRMLIQQANTFKRKELAYKQRLERQGSDLQIAETEVDLLGDEVDALLSLLSKIYIALDHYSLILQHYPGIMEALKLVKKKLKGETTKLVDQKYPLEGSIATSSTSTAVRRRTIGSHYFQSKQRSVE